MSEINGKTALITGASRGVGAAAARYFADQGAAVTLMARDAAAIEAIAAEIIAKGGRALPLAGDVARYRDMENAVAQAVAAFGRLDILVNNAGVIEPIARLADSDPEAWGAMIDVNLKGVYHGLRAAIPAMTSGGGGVVVNISSGAATGALEGWSHYCASKAGALSLTRCAAKEYGPEGVRVVGLSPGTVATDMQTQIKASGLNPVSQLDPSAHIPPEWVARAIGYLCGPDGAEFEGRDFSIKTDDGRARVGLPPVSAPS